MGVALGWIAFALAGVAATPHTGRPAEEITYTVRYVETEGVGWREAVFARLKPVARQGAATVWTLPEDARARLLEQVTKNPAGSVVQAPKVTAFPGAVASVHSRSSRKLVTQAAWNGDEPAAAESVRIGWHTTMVGRKLDQGVLVQIVLEDTEIRAVHHVNLPSVGKIVCPELQKTKLSTPPVGCNGAGKAAGMTANPSSWTAKKAVAEAAIDADKCCDDSESCPATIVKTGKDRDIRTVSVDVPEIGSQEVAGEWLIPNGECLLVSFGAYTVADKDGKAVVKERLAVVEAEEKQVSADIPTASRPIVIPPPAPIVANPGDYVAPKVALPVPVIPSRSYPEGIHADGKPADLPVLPDDEAADSSTDSSEPRPSPQTKKPIKPEKSPKPAADTRTSKAEFVAPKVQPFSLSSFMMSGVGNGFQFLMPIKPFSLKLPFNQKLEVEVLGRVVPDTETR